MQRDYTVFAFLRWLYHDTLDYLCSRHRATLLPSSASAGTRGGTIARGDWRPLAKRGLSVSFDWSRFAVWRYVDRRVIETLVVAAVLFPLMGYYFSVAVPAVMRFWTARF